MQWGWLVYRLPREPSSPRIAVWRKLRGLGVAQVTDGVAALPLDARNRERLEWLADEVAEAGGEAMVWLAEPTSAAAERRLVERLAEDRAGEYRRVREQAERALAAQPGVRRRELRRLRAELRRICRRDYFPPAEQDEAATAVNGLAEPELHQDASAEER